MPTTKKVIHHTKSLPVANNSEAAKALKNSRRLKRPSYKSFKFSKRIKNPTKLPSGFQLSKQVVNTFMKAPKLFVGIAAIYGILNVLLVQGLGNTSNIETVKNTLAGASGLAHVAGGVSLFAVLVASSGSSSSTAAAGVYQVLLVLIVSLVVIWALRQVIGGTVVRIRDAFYQGTYPLVQFILVLLVISIQLIPAALGAILYNVVVTNSIATLPIQKTIWGLLALLLGMLSFYMLTSSIFALYIVTLPKMTPMKALRSAREIVRYRRWTVMRKLLFLPVALFVIAAIIMVPIILTVTAAAYWVFFILSMFGMVITHTYIYTLYRELLV
jgi:hypothetical protein